MTAVRAIRDHRIQKNIAARAARSVSAYVPRYARHTLLTASATTATVRQGLSAQRASAADWQLMATTVSSTHSAHATTTTMATASRATAHATTTTARAIHHASSRAIVHATTIRKATTSSRAATSSVAISLVRVAISAREDTSSVAVTSRADTSSAAVISSVAAISRAVIANTRQDIIRMRSTA